MPRTRSILLFTISLFFTLNAAPVGNAGLVRDRKPMSPEQIQSEFKKFQKPSRLTGHFEQVKTIKEIDVQIKTSGQFEIRRQSNHNVSLVWKIEKPDPMMVCIDDETVVFDNPRLKKKSTLKMSEISSQDSAGLTKLVQLIKMNPDLLASDFLVATDNKKYYISPKDKKNYQFSNAEVELDPKKNVREILLNEVNGDELLIKFAQTKEATLNEAELKTKACR